MYNNIKNINKINKLFCKLNVKFNTTSLKGSPSCGDMILLKFYIRSNIIYNINFNVYGCSSAISVLYIIYKFIIFKNIYKIIFIKNNFISQFLKLIPIKLHCSVLLEFVLKCCISKFKNNYVICYDL